MSPVSENPPSPRRLERIAKLCGLGTGLALAAICVSAWSVPGGTGIAGAEVSMLANMSGELAVSPAGKPFLREGYLLPGQSAKGSLDIRNQTHKPLLVTLRATAETPDLEQLLRIEVRSGRQLLYRGRLKGLGRFTKTALRLDVADRRTLAARAWVPEGGARRAGNRAAEISLELRSVPAEARS